MAALHINKTVSNDNGVHMEISKELEKKLFYALSQELYEKGIISYEFYRKLKVKIERS